MFYQQDWMMRQIEIIVEALLRILFHKTPVKTELNGEQMSLTGVKQVLLEKLRAYIREGRFCEAEDLLYEKLDLNDHEILAATIQFYGELNALSDEELEAHNFSREEILTGLTDVCKRYGLSEVELFAGQSFDEIEK